VPSAVIFPAKIDHVVLQGERIGDLASIKPAERSAHLECEASREDPEGGEEVPWYFHLGCVHRASPSTRSRSPRMRRCKGGQQMAIPIPMISARPGSGSQHYGARLIMLV